MSVSIRRKRRSGNGQRRLAAAKAQQGGTAVRQGSQAAHREMRARAALSLNMTVKAYLVAVRRWNAGEE